MRKKYPSDLSDKRWKKIKHFFENENRGRHFRTQSKRILVNAVLYIVKTGCQWRQLPNDFPNWKTVYSFYERAIMSGIWDKIRAMLVRKSRIANGRNPEPSYGLIDSCSRKTAFAAQNRGFDGGKKVKGRKCHIVTDILGHLLYVMVHAANIHDGIAGGDVARGAIAEYPSLEGFCGDAAYRKTFEEEMALLGLSVDIVERIQGAGWMILPKRWRVERTFGWMCGSRRLSKDYEILTTTAKNMIIISHVATLLNRI